MGNRRRVLLLSLLSALVVAVVALLFTVGPLSSNKVTGGNSGTPGSSGSQGNNGTPASQDNSAMRPINGRVLDLDAGTPIAGAEIMAAGVLTATSPEGLFYFEDVPVGSKVVVSADGYDGVEVEAGAEQLLAPIKLKANVLSGHVTDATTGKPLGRVLVRLTLASSQPVTDTAATPDANGTADPQPTGTVTSSNSLRVNGLSAPLAASRVPSAAVSKGTATSPPVPTSTTVPPTATPRHNTTPPVGDGFVATYTDDNGDYVFKAAPKGSTLTFKMPGYKLAKAPVEGVKKDIALEQFRVEAFYMTANVASVKSLYDELVDFAVESRFNAVVLNVQTDASAWVFDTKNPDALEADNTDIILPNIADVVKDLKSKGFYTIGRVVTFQQKTMALARPDWAVKSSVTGKPWRGGYSGQQVWLDASNPNAQDYVLDMVKEVLELGFDEIQFDYIRFPSDPWENEPGKMVFSKMPMPDPDKVKVLQQFLTKAQSIIDPTDAFMSIDIFGYTLWPDQEGVPILGLIGQVLPDLVDYADYISPMIYPSHFSPGEQGCAVPAKCAYKLIKQSGVYAESLFEGARSKYRPWLQDFDWGPTDYTSPGTTKVKEQIDACEETNCWGWLMWDPANVYEPRSVFKKPK
jgi:hypothetical protein